MKEPKSALDKRSTAELTVRYIYTLFCCTPPWEVNGVRAGSLQASIARIAAGLVTREPNRELDISGIL